MPMRVVLAGAVLYQNIRAIGGQNADQAALLHEPAAEREVTAVGEEGAAAASAGDVEIQDLHVVEVRAAQTIAGAVLEDDALAVVERAALEGDRELLVDTWGDGLLAHQRTSSAGRP